MFPDAREGLAIAAMEAAEMMNAGMLDTGSPSRRFQRLIEQLATELAALDAGHPLQPSPALAVTNA